MDKVGIEVTFPQTYLSIRTMILRKSTDQSRIPSEILPALISLVSGTSDKWLSSAPHRVVTSRAGTKWGLCVGCEVGG